MSYTLYTPYTPTVLSSDPSTALNTTLASPMGLDDVLSLADAWHVAGNVYTGAWPGVAYTTGTFLATVLNTTWQQLYNGQEDIHTGNLTMPTNYTARLTSIQNFLKGLNTSTISSHLEISAKIAAMVTNIESLVALRK